MEAKMDVFWGDSLEVLAASLFARERKQGLFTREAVVVGSPLTADWLQQFYLYDLTPRPKQILANWDFLQLHPFVNDWLEKAVHGTPVGERKPVQHPYASDVLQWRLWEILAEPDCDRKYPLLHRYGSPDPRRRLDLTATLARLFDDYQNYRSKTLTAWLQPGSYQELDDDDRWQADLWRELVSRNPMTYIQTFLDCRHNPDTLGRSGISGHYARVSIFNLTVLSPLYRDFFQQLARILPVELYQFNPSQDFWLEDSARRSLDEPGTLSQPRPTDQPDNHPLRASLGKGLQPLLRAIVDDNNVNHEFFTPPLAGPASLLHRLQQSIRASTPELTPELTPEPPQLDSPGANLADSSLQIHLCHNPQREVEVVREQLRHWFATHPGSQPRDVQVLVADYPTFVPLLEAAFNINHYAQTIPALFLYQPPASAGAAAAAFQKLLELGDSRMTTPEIFAILSVEPVAARYGLSATDLDSLNKLLADARLSWGRDRTHAAACLGLDQAATAAFPDTMTWQRGLDRLLIGLCHGPATVDEPLGCVDSGCLGPLCLVPEVEGEGVPLLNAFIAFYDDLLQTIEECRPPRTVPDWCDVYAGILSRFFIATEHSHCELSQIRRTLQKIRTAALGAALQRGPQADPALAVTVEPAVMAAHVEKHNRSLASANNCTANAVIFSPLQTMCVTPRRLLVVMGLSEGVFPRADSRIPFDLLDHQYMDGDRSLRREDRLAFLEAIMHAREQLLLTYTGLSDTQDDHFPPSTVLQELIDYMAPALQPIRHPLNPHDPRYFTPDHPELVSYSRRHYREACTMATAAATAAAGPDSTSSFAPAVAPVSLFSPADLADPPDVITLTQLHNFFANPAKDFLTRILRLYLSGLDDNQLADSEMFVTDNLERYLLNDFILQQLLAAAKNGEVPVTREKPKKGEKPTIHGESFWQHQRLPLLTRLQESGMLPLGTPALPMLASGTEKIYEEVFATYRNELCSSYAFALQSLPAAKPFRLTLTPGDVPVDLTGDLASADGKQLLFRYAAKGGKDYVKAWISHLFACACGESVQTMVGGQYAPQSFDPIDRGAARDILGNIVRCYLSARFRCLPFAPQPAFDFKDAYEKNMDNDMAAALNKARQKWAPSSFNTPPDRYMLKIWGPDGPLDHPAVADFLSLFWGLKHFAAQPEGDTP